MTGNYFLQGIQHITDLEGYDHMLFLAALCAPFSIRQWKTVLLLATAFTVGHSISLALAAMQIIQFNRDIIELLIAISILATAVINIFKTKMDSVSILSYVITSAFGIIHGMGFSGYFRMISDDSESIIGQLFLFNLGVEAGQIFIILLFFGLIYLVSQVVTDRRKLCIAISVVAALLAAWMVVERI